MLSSLFPETGYVDVIDPGHESVLLMEGNELPVHPMENHKEHLMAHASARQHAVANQLVEALPFFDAHMQEHLRLAGAQAQTPPQPYGQAGPNGQAQAPAPQQPGSRVGGGVGDVMGKQAAEAPMQGM